MSCHSQFSSVPQSCPTLWDPMDCSMPGFSVHHQLLEFTQTHVHQVGNATQPSHPLLSSSPPAFNLSQHHSLFQGVSSSHQMVKVLEFELHHQSFQWRIFRMKDYNADFVGKVMSLLFNMLSRLVIAFLLRSKHLLISWLQLPSAVILEPKKIVSHCSHCFPVYLPWSDGIGCHGLHFLNTEF